MKTVTKAFAPATISNLACGFDVLGLALEELGDEVIARLSDDPGVRILSMKGHKKGISKNPERNTAGVAVIEYLKFRGLSEKIGINLELIKKIPLGSGLGGSAASAVAAVVAVDKLMDTPLEKRALLDFAYRGEKIVDDSLPADNISASLLGGICLTQSLDPLKIHRIPIPSGIHIVVLLPKISILTKENRKNIAAHVSLENHIKQNANIASFVLGCIRGNWDIIKDSLQDFIIEHQRADTIPHFYDIQAAAMENRALGCSISGSGPAIFAFCMNSADAGSVEEAFAEVCKKKGIEADSFISKISNNGAYCY